MGASKTFVAGWIALSVSLSGWGCAAGLSDSDSAGASTGDGTPGGGAGGANGPGDGKPKCSDDLRSVLDANGNVVETCPPDQGCSNGKCVEACKAAADNHGNVGCDFVVATPQFLPYTTQPCFAAFVANTWPEPVHLDVRFGTTVLDASAFGRIPNGSPNPADWPALPAAGLPPDEVVVLFLSADPYSSNAGTSLACPVAPALGQATSLPSTGRGQTFHIGSDYPVSVYDIMPFGGALSFLPGAELVLPTSAWGRNYVPGIAAVQTDPATPYYPGPGGPMWAQIVAAQDDTTVEILPKHFTGFPGGTGVAEAPGGQKTTFVLSAGEMIQWSPMADPSGSIFKSNKPIAFIGGNGELCLYSNTSQGGGCDSAHQQVAPVAATGFDYAVAPYATRRADMQDESVLYRVVGAVADTTLVFDPPVDGAPATLGVGEFVDFQARGAFRMSSQDAKHPFQVLQLMPGGFVEGGSRPGVTPGTIEGGQLGDEEVVAVLPPQQYQSRYVFFTDPTYGTTSLVLVRVRLPEGFADVDIDCLGTVGGWKPLGSDGHYEFTDVDLVRSGTPSGCANGRHVAESKGRFGLVVWGLDAWASYAYPAGAAVAPINDVEVVPEPK